MLSSDPITRITKRFCGLSLVALDMLTTQKRNLIGSLQGRRSGNNRRFLDSDAHPREYLKGLMYLMPPLSATTPSGKKLKGPKSILSVLPNAALFTSEKAIKHLGDGGDYRWFEFSVYYHKKSGVDGLPTLFPVLFARLLFGKASEGRRYAVEIIGDGILDPDIAPPKIPIALLGGTVFAPGTASGDYTLRDDVGSQTSSRVFLSDPDETLEQFSASVMLSIGERILLPKLERASSVNGNAMETPPFSVDVTCVSDNYSRATVLASPPTW